jgi:hypothetical protein
MSTCSKCNSSYEDSKPFCPNCGAQPGSSNKMSYGGSVLLGIGLLAVAIVWKLASIPTPTQPGADTTLASPEVPDEAEALIAKCGKPDVDKLRNTQPQTRLLVYQKARVRAVFVRADPREKWKTQGMLDPKTLRPLAADKLARRLPCNMPEPTK